MLSELKLRVVPGITLRAVARPFSSIFVVFAPKIASLLQLPPKIISGSHAEIAMNLLRQHNNERVNFEELLAAVQTGRNVNSLAMTTISFPAFFHAILICAVLGFSKDNDDEGDFVAVNVAKLLGLYNTMRPQLEKTQWTFFESTTDCRRPTAKMFALRCRPYIILPYRCTVRETVLQVLIATLRCWNWRQKNGTRDFKRL